MGQMLTVGDVAALKGCTPRYIKRIIKEGKLPAEETLNQRKRKTYQIPLTALEEELQRKWQRKQFRQEKRGEGMERPPKQAAEPSSSKDEKALDRYTEQEREEMDFWRQVIKEWLQYRGSPEIPSKAEADASFAHFLSLKYPAKNISVDILYRRWKAVREGDLDGLIDRRGKWRSGRSSIHEIAWQAFLYYFLDESKHPLVKCWMYTKLWLQEVHPELVTELPSHYSFRRKLEFSLPKPVLVEFREGKKAFYDQCRAYILRLYEDLHSNEYWIADNHTFDVIVVDKAGKQHRPTLTAYLDARSGIFTGYYVTYSPSSDATLIALRRGIEKYGIPENIYVDNGREFLASDVGGLGHRQKKKEKGEEVYLPPGVFSRLGIQMTNAIVRNARAKIIERRFRDVKDGLSRLFKTFTGGNVVEKPDRLKHVLKKGQIYTDEEFESIVSDLIDYYFNLEPYNGRVEEDKGKLKKDIYHEQLLEKRTAKSEDLTLLMMRSSRVQTVGRRGVHLDIRGGRIDYWTPEFLVQMMGRKVYYRYNPDDLSSVRIYDLKDRYLCTVEADNEAVATYGASRETIGIAMAKIGRVEKLTRELGESMILKTDRKTAMELVLSQAERNRKEYTGRADPKIIELKRVVEEPLLQKVAGAPDLDRMVRNAEKERKE